MESITKLSYSAGGQFIRWRKEGTAGICDIKSMAEGGKDGNCLISLPYKGSNIDVIIDFSEGVRG